MLRRGVTRRNRGEPPNAKSPASAEPGGAGGQFWLAAAGLVAGAVTSFRDGREARLAGTGAGLGACFALSLRGRFGLGCALGSGFGAPLVGPRWAE